MTYHTRFLVVERMQIIHPPFGSAAGSIPKATHVNLSTAIDPRKVDVGAAGSFAP